MAATRITYVDGARDPASGHSGCSYVYFVTSEGCWRGASRALGRLDDSRAAEEAAILAALESGIKSGSGHFAAFTVRSDALWVVDDIRGHRYGFQPSNSAAIQEIVSAIHKLEATDARVTVEWVAAHSGLEGNEVADYAAREARIRSPLCIHGRATLTMPVKLWSPGPEEEKRYSKPTGRIEFSREHDRLLAYAASDEGLPRFESEREDTPLSLYVAKPGENAP